MIHVNLVRETIRIAHRLAQPRKQRGGGGGGHIVELRCHSRVVGGAPVGVGWGVGVEV